MGKLFGTDGIRGVANHYPVTAEMALKTSSAVAICAGMLKRQ
jgi:phosphoglucosamine mutase